MRFMFSSTLDFHKSHLVFHSQAEDLPHPCIFIGVRTVKRSEATSGGNFSIQVFENPIYIHDPFLNAIDNPDGDNGYVTLPLSVHMLDRQPVTCFHLCNFPVIFGHIRFFHSRSHKKNSQTFSKNTVSFHQKLCELLDKTQRVFRHKQHFGAKYYCQI